MKTKKKILITGREGFTGHYLSKELEDAGYDVVGLVYQDPKADEIACDLTDKAQVETVIDKVKPDGIIHLAALSFVGHDDPSAFYKVNIFSTLHLLEAMERAKLNPEKIVIASSANIYGNPRVPVIDETTQPNPVNHYAASKLAMEYMVKNWFDRFPIIITRPFNYTGPGQHPKFLVPKIVSHYKDNKKQIELGNLDVARDFSDVRDVAKSYRKLLESPACSEVVNLCSGRVSKLEELVETMNQIAGYSMDVQINPEFIRPDEIKVLCGDPKKLRSLAGFEHAIGMNETLQAMFNA